MLNLPLPTLINMWDRQFPTHLAGRVPSVARQDTLLHGQAPHNVTEFSGILAHGWIAPPIRHCIVRLAIVPGARPPACPL